MMSWIYRCGLALFLPWGFALLPIQPASAQLFTLIQGVPGAGETTFTLSGSSILAVDETARATGANGFDNGDTAEIGPGNFILSNRNDSNLNLLSGGALVTINGVTSTLTQVFADDDGVVNDDFGFRLSSALSYSAGDAISWTGIFTTSLDINEFNLGSFSNSRQTFVDTEEWIITTSQFVVPEPSSVIGTVAAVVLGGGAWVLRRRQ